MTKGNSTNSIRGINIYYDDKNRSVYYDRLTKKGYLIQEKNAQEYSMFQNRFVIVAVCMILAATFIPNYALVAALGIFALAIFEYRFRAKFLKTLTILGNFKPTKKPGIYDGEATKELKNKRLLKAVLYFALAVLLVLNVYTTEYDMLIIVVSYALSAVALYSSIMNFMAYRKSTV